MSDLARQCLAMVLVAAYAVSASICACRSMRMVARPAAHPCCHRAADGVPPAPARPHPAKQCPHCGGGVLATAEPKQLGTMNQSGATPVVTIAAPTRPCIAQSLDRGHAISRHFIPSPTLLQLHCALTT